MEQRPSALNLEKPAEVDSYLEVMEQLCLQAEPAASTARVLQQILSDIKSRPFLWRGCHPPCRMRSSRARGGPWPLRRARSAPRGAPPGPRTPAPHKAHE